MADGKPDIEEGPSNGITRRNLLKAGGLGLAATAVIVGTGSTPAGAVGPAAAGVQQPPPPRGPLREEDDPHVATERTTERRQPRVQLQDGILVRILPINRAKFLAGGRFDLRVEAVGVDPATTRIKITVGRQGGTAPILHNDPERTSSAPDSLEVTYRGLSYPSAGDYKVTAAVESGGNRAKVTVNHQVVAATVSSRRAKNVIFFLGDGMGQAAVTAARLLSKGITQGKYNGLLNMDQMEYRGLVGTSGVDSIATDSANSMSAYMTGHKSSVNAMGVYEANDPDPARHPRVENFAELLKRSRNMAIGVVTTAEIQDATPAAVWAHNRRRSEYINIMDQALDPEQRPDVILGGGAASLLPRTVPGSRRTDDRDLRQEFRDLGYSYVSTRAELDASMSGRLPERLLGTFHPGNLNVYLDRQHSPDPAVLGAYTDQPTLMEMTRAALKVLDRTSRGNGFFLMVEGASIDKMEHPLDGPRAVYDAIEFDQAIGVAREWSRRRDDTLIVITADHNHSMSIVGTQDRRLDPNPHRQGNGVYGDAGWPTYVDSNGDGFPDDPNPDVQLFFGWSNHPDHPDDFRHNPLFLQPALFDATGRAVPNPNRDPGALVQVGNLPYNQNNCVHTVEDVNVFASGPGAARFNAFMDNTEIFFAIADGLGLEVPLGSPATRAAEREVALDLVPAG